MPVNSDLDGNHSRRLNGRAARTRSIGTKLTPDKEKEILSAAEAQGKVPSEWARDLLLRGAVSENRDAMDMHIFTELVGIQMLLMNTLEPLLSGERLSHEQVAAHFREVQTTKAAKAQELLAKRSHNQEK
jgi:hypothetical protein